MHLIFHEDKSKLHSYHTKSLPKLIKQACAQCKGLCIRTSSSLSSMEEDYNYILDNTHHDHDLHEKQDIDHYMIILEIIQSGALKSKQPKYKELMFRGKLIWPADNYLPTSKRNTIITEDHIENKIEGVDHEQQVSTYVDHGDHDDDISDDESESFFSVLSYLSLCSGEKEIDYNCSDQMKSILVDELKDCKGWPFGLYKRPVRRLLPPLPSSPSDSWMWRKRNNSLQ